MLKINEKKLETVVEDIVDNILESNNTANMVTIWHNPSTGDIALDASASDGYNYYKIASYGYYLNSIYHDEEDSEWVEKWATEAVDVIRQDIIDYINR